MNPSMIKKLLLISLSVFAISTQSPAEDSPSETIKAPIIDGHEKKIRLEIDEGIKSGELTANETKFLQNQLKQIEKMEEQARKTGTMLGSTRKNLRDALDRLDKDVYRLTHNAEKTAPGKSASSPSPTAPN